MQVFIDNVVANTQYADAHHYSLFVFTIKASLLFIHPDVINIPLSTYSGASLTDADAPQLTPIVNGINVIKERVVKVINNRGFNGR